MYNRVSIRLFFFFSVGIFFLYSNSALGQPNQNRKGIIVKGSITDQFQKPVVNVVVSDGYSCVSTNNKGEYSMVLKESSKFIYYSTPSGYEITTESVKSNYPRFYINLDSVSLLKKTTGVNFVLKKLQKEEKDFNIIGIGDPQVRNLTHIEYFKNETLQDLKKTVDSYSVNSYGLVLGDVLFDKPKVAASMKEALSLAPIPLFVTIGNHDKFSDDKARPRTGELFSNYYGPLNYSFNRGDVHFVCLDNVFYTEYEKYRMYFSDEQIEWLKQDLSFVPKNKMVVIYYHIPLRNKKIPNKDNLLNLLKDYKEVHLMSGHTHYNQNYIYKQPYGNIYEHIHAAACGAWWQSNINGDGTPNGYAVYEVKGNTMANWYYKGVGLPKDFQIRLYKGDTIFGGEYGSFSFERPADYLIANVWNADKKWTIEVYEDNKQVGLMQAADFTKEAWAKGYHIGVLKRNPKNYNTHTTHLYVHKIVNPAAKIRVVAKDRFGNEYSQEEITGDFSQAIRNK